MSPAASRSTRRSREGWRGILAFVLVGVFAAQALACTRPGAACDPAPPPACWNLAPSVVGPEDLVFDQADERLLVSSQDRRTEPEPRGGIWSVPLKNDGTAHELALVGRDDCSFHPHGIDLVQAKDENGNVGSWLLYVINHHDAADREPKRGCFSAAGLRGVGSGPITSVEVFRVGRYRLEFLQRLADPAILTHANDLVALPDGDLWVTDPPRGKLATLLDATGLRPSSKIDHFDCVARSDGRCRGTWKTAPIVAAGGEHPKIPEANGIAYRACPAASSGAVRGGCSDRLYVAAGAGGAIHVFDVTADGALLVSRVIEMPGKTNPDNLTWANAEKTRLLAAAHPDLRRFLQHMQAPEVPSPSEVVEVSVVDGASLRRRILRDEGGLISAASVALRLRGTPRSSADIVVLGQVFDSGVFACQMPDSSGWGGQP